MRLAIVTETYPPEINGVSLSVARNVAWLRERGHAVDLIRPRQSDERRGALGPANWLSAASSLPMYREVRFGWALPSTLAARFGRTRPQLVHVATPGPLGCAALLAASRLGIATSTDFRTRFDTYAGHYGLGWLTGGIAAYLRWFHNRSQRTFVPTRRLARDLRAAGFERLTVLGRGVDTDRFTPARRDPALRRAWGAGDDDRVLLHVGRLAAEKQVDLALAAVAAALPSHPGARTVVVGDGPQRKVLERRYPDARFVGMQTGDALAAHYASADIFLFPSRSETFGNVTLEALASGLAVVAFDLAAAADHIRHGVGGWLVSADDEAGFAGATAQLLSMPATALAALRQQARDSALQATWPALLRQFEQTLSDLAGAEGRPLPSPQAWSEGPA